MTPWTKFWQSYSKGFDKMMWVCTIYFAKRFAQKFKIDSEDKILDVGCGPGFLAEYLAQNIIINNYVGLDINENYLSICQNKLKNATNYNFLAINPQDYLNFEDLKNYKFTKIIVMSVIQYFKNIGEVEKLIIELQKLAEKDSVLIIADVITDKFKISDLLKLAKQAWQNSFFWIFIQFLLYARFSMYYQYQKQTGLLTIPSLQLLEITQKLNLQAEIIQNLTINTNRYSLVIYF